MITISYEGTSNGGAIGLGGSLRGGAEEVLEFPAGEYCRSSLALAQHVLGAAMPARAARQRPWGLDFSCEGEISDEQAEELRRIFRLANDMYASTGGDRHAAWRAVVADTGRPS